jgi:heavy metal sensor kinase
VKGLQSLRGRIAVWSGLLFLLLYAAAFTLVLAIDARNRKSELQLVLYAEAESLAGYYATGRLDFPELDTYEKSSPVPVWMRVIRSGRVLASTPGMPAVPVVDGPPLLHKLEIEEMPLGRPVGVVRHDVWNRPGTYVEAITGLDMLERRQRDLAFALSLAGLLLLPLAILGGRFVADRALRPVERLVESVRALHSERLDERLEAPGAVVEIAQLTDEFNRLLDRLEESVAAMQRFTADASHELRTPISILRTGLEVALRKDRPPEEYRELMRENLVEIQRIGRIVEGLLTLARARHGAEASSKGEEVDLSATVAGAVESIRLLAREKEVELRARILPGMRVRGDVDKLRLMILNLLDNAVKFTPAGRTVHVCLDELPERVRFQVRDEGPGVPPEDRPHVFDRFFRGKGPHASGASAGGLGLSVVRWVAEIHGGEVRLLADGPQGAIFEVLLPRLAAPELAAAAS